MTIIDCSGGQKNFVRAMLEAKENVEHQHELLIRHQTGIAATLIGLIAVFGDMSQESTPLRYLTISSVIFLLLAVLSGVLYCFLQYKLRIQGLVNVLRQYQAGNFDVLGETSSPAASLLARAFPWLLCIGILLLSASAVFALLPR